jgi:hypothetical protein
MTRGQTIAALAATFVVALVLGVAVSHNFSLNDWSYWYRVKRHQDNVHVSVVPRCGDPEYPLRVTIDNKSGRTVEGLRFILARESLVEAQILRTLRSAQMTTSSLPEMTSHCATSFHSCAKR